MLFYALYGDHPQQAWDVEVDVPKGEAPAACEQAARIQEVHARLTECLQVAPEGEEYEVEQVLDERTHKNRKEYLVQWKEYPTWEDSWQSKENLTNAQEVVIEFWKKRDTIGPLKQMLQKSERKCKQHR
ncbi:hypothetical protein GP486_007113 [Trichoglossum hirsutum]|uniref:Chromo domain-containing protein n=1 Tax=Trichoglossum hirsutum TaxID=265104 RepID=A0A9P8L718_9PEZI|nr:hypothetical protein GP486_007113 [Trichoglossum hirsutum]